MFSSDSGNLGREIDDLESVSSSMVGESTFAFEGNVNVCGSDGARRRGSESSLDVDRPSFFLGEKKFPMNEPVRFRPE